VPPLLVFAPLLSFAVALLLVAALRGRLARMDGVRRLIVLSAPAWGGIAIGLLVTGVIATPHLAWNSVRLAPTFAFVARHDLFTPLEKGWIFGSLYPPLSYLTYLPAVLAKSPTQALLLAGSVNVLLLCLPLAVALRRQFAGRDAALATALGVALFVASTYPSVALTVQVVQIHSALPGLAFALAACPPLCPARAAPSWKQCQLSALFLALSVWCKQPFIALAPALATYVALAYGAREAWRYTWRAAATGILFSLLMAAFFGFEALLFNILLYPTLHPWGKGGSMLVGEALQAALPYLGVLAVAALGRRLARGAAPAQGWRSTLRSESWAQLLLVALFFVPLSLLQRLRWGGWLNGYHFVFFLAVAALLLLLQLVIAANGGARRRGVAWCAIGVALLSLAVAAPQLADLPFHWRNLPRSTPAVAFAYLRENPGSAYFPLNPLATYLAEGRIYHLDDGLFSLHLAGRQPERLHDEGYLPRGIDFVIFRGELLYGPPQTRNRPFQHRDYYRTMRYYPAYRQLTPAEIRTRPELAGIPPDWVVFAVPP
jgi:hypothetical protein